MPDAITETPPAPVDLEALAERVRTRLTAHGQHGALAEFAKYHAAVQEQLASRGVTVDELVVIKEQVAAAAPGVPTSAQGSAKRSKAAAKKGKSK